MKNKYIGWFSRLMISASVISLASCADDDLFYKDNSRRTEFLEFTTSLYSDEPTTRSRGTASHLEIEEEDWDLAMLSEGNRTATRGSLLTLLDGNEAGVIGFFYDKGDSEKTAINSDNNTSFTFTNDDLSASPGTDPIRWNRITKDNLDIYAYSPRSAEGLTVNTANTPTLTYKVPRSISAQKDIIVSKWTNTEGVDFKGLTIPLNFSHILTGVRFRVGFSCTVKSVEVSGVYSQGVYDFDRSDWIIDETSAGTSAPDGEEESSEATASYRLDFGETGRYFESGTTINGGANTMILLPQTLPAGAKITLTCLDSSNDEKVLTADIESLKWRQGKLISYTLYEGQPPSIIYLDLAAGDVTINGDTYKGYRFDAANNVVEITDKHKAENNYYVYQSTSENRSSIFSDDNGNTMFTSPAYKTVIAPDGQDWRDYIVNNTDVDAVIDAWCKGSDQCARDAGREPTEYRIDVKGNLTCNLTIDNIYSVHQYADNPQYRNTAGISFLPSGNNSTLKISTIGDNRVGAVHYYNETEGNEIIFEGSGSLTVADVDGVKQDVNYDANCGLGPGEGKGYWSNHWASAIGANDLAGENSVGIVIKSGRIFAGTTKAENCTAIGGGGNGLGVVTIEGGVVTAVATTTGTAIGGGIGFNQPGGVGDVTIKGGNVYAYNHANRWDIPSSAIGGAGSRSNVGSNGTVTITDGSVYAVSDLGTAIGAGSSCEREGGEMAKITISGGEIVAKTKSPISTSIGGGSSYTKGADGHVIVAIVTRSNFTEADWNRYGEISHEEGWNGTENIRNGCGIGDYFKVIGKATDTGHDHVLIYKSDTASGKLHGMCVGHRSSGDKKDKVYDGGHAEIEISGNPIIRTGSIGGGGTGDPSGHTGNATIKVENGDIQAQFILAAGTEVGKTPTFTMTGGTIRNSNTSDPEYLHVHRNGGAVYLEDGIVNISGGTITKCSADYGGAVYIKGGSGSSFNMSGGKIVKNSSSLDGGAIFMENGVVTLTGGSINDNLTVAGNGGGIYIIGGRLDIPAGSGVEMRQNSAQEELDKVNNVLVGGYGGAIYISSYTTPVKANIAAGTIYGNTSDNKGGGICIDMNTSDLEAEVVIGTEGGSDKSPMITRNSTLMQGGGLYARGINARLTMNSGSIIDNQVSQYVTNEDVTNELGSVTLNGGNVTHNIVTFHANDGKSPEQTTTQNIVTSTNSILKAPVFERTGYKLVGWNTRPGGNGTNYTDGQIMNISNNIHLYARWVPDI